MRFALYDDEGRELHAAEVEGDRLASPPEGAPRLRPGRVYYVEVRSVGGSRSLAVSEFAVLSAQESAGLASAEEEARRRAAASPDDPAPWILLAMKYLALDMPAEAGRCLDELARRAPDSPGVQRLRARVTSRLGGP